MKGAHRYHCDLPFTISAATSSRVLIFKCASRAASQIDLQADFPVAMNQVHDPTLLEEIFVFAHGQDSRTF